MKNLIKITCFIGLSSLLISCGQTTKAKSKDRENQTEKPQLKVVQIKNDTLNYDLTLPGNLKPYEQVKLYGKVEGFVTSLKVDRGDEVKKGQLLMKIEAPEIEQQFLAAKAKEREISEKLQFSKQNYERTKDAADVDGVVSATELQQAKTQFVADSAAYRAVKAEVAAAHQLAKYTQITAPFDGIVTERFVSPGALVGRGEKPLVEIKREDKLRLEVAIPAKHAKSLQLEAEASFAVNSLPGKRFPIKISRSSKSFNSELRAMMIEFDYDNSKTGLNGGDYAQVNLHLKRHEPSLLVPSSSIITTTTNVFIAKVTNHKIQLTPIITGLSKNNQTEIFGDIKAGDTIILKGNSTLKNDTEIDLKK